MDKKSIINFLLIFISTSLFLISIGMFILSFLTLFNFFNSNINFFKNFQQKDNALNEVTLYNPGPMNIKELSVNSKIYFLNKSYDFLRFNSAIAAKEEKKIALEVLNKSLIEDEIKNYFLEVFNEYKDIEYAKNKILNEIRKGVLVSEINVSLEDLLKIDLMFEIGLYDLIKIGSEGNIIWKS